MAEITIFDQDKKEAGSVLLSPEIFEVPVRAEILNLVVRAQRAMMRAGTHATQNRAKKEATGAKPWRQKGTGRARAGSYVSPLWTGGAVTFGPQPRDYGFKVNRKVWTLALKMALSARHEKGNLMVVNKIDLPEAKTKLFAQVKDKLELTKALVVIPAGQEELILASRNIQGITLVTPDRLNVYDVLKHDQLVLFEEVLETVTARLSA